MSTYFLGNGQVVLGTLKRSNKLFKRTLPRSTPGGKLRLRSHGSVGILDRLKKNCTEHFSHLEPFEIFTLYNGNDQPG